MKTQAVLQFVRETKGTVVYGVPDIRSQIIGQVYVNKTHLERKGDTWPTSITITVEANA